MMTLVSNHIGLMFTSTLARRLFPKRAMKIWASASVSLTLLTSYITMVHALEPPNCPAEALGKTCRPCIMKLDT
jgi:hypothetical protein